MARMAAESLPPTPQHFAIWYSYYSGDLPDLNRALDKLAEAGHGVTAERLAELHDRFFSLDHEKQAVREAGARIQGALSHLLELLRASGAGSDRYGRALQQFGENMEVRGLEQLSALVDSGALPLPRRPSAAPRARWSLPRAASDLASPRPRPVS